ncbi:MAG: DUF4912 domain-containing protein [Firmicutes bacterium]|nr:DUF4912 domain-containing protein [Bacillota bacterium]MCL5038244.1 DUF4912 domain-containing protein [Bacillota bacterium]
MKFWQILLLAVLGLAGIYLWLRLRPEESETPRLREGERGEEPVVPKETHDVVFEASHELIPEVAARIPPEVGISLTGEDTNSLPSAPFVARQAELGAEKPRERSYPFPALYNEDRLTLLVRDPWWIFAYWEKRPGPGDSAVILRCYDATVDGKTPFEIPLPYGAQNWYINVFPDHSYFAELGYYQGDRFVVLARSNTVHTPWIATAEAEEGWVTAASRFGGPITYSSVEMVKKREMSPPG